MIRWDARGVAAACLAAAQGLGVRAPTIRPVFVSWVPCSQRHDDDDDDDDDDDRDYYHC